MKTKLFTLMLAVAASVGTMRAAIVNGTCGETLTWSLNTKDSTLIIEGSGAMTNWSAFECPWLEYSSYIAYVSLPDGLTSIGSHAFYECTVLTSIEIPNSVKSIRSGAFNGCTGLTSITIPNSVTSIRSRAFLGCSSLTSIEIPNSVTSIGEAAFRNCTGLTSVTIPNSVTSIGNEAFYNCSGLTSVTIPSSVTSIGDYAFSECSGLTSVTIPNGITSIGKWAFFSCTNLTSVTIPNSVTSIEESAFYNCSSLVSITCEAITPPTLSQSTFYNVDKSIPLFVPEESIEAYANSLGWEDFTNIRAIGSAPLVQFVDWDGTILSSEFVSIGTAATAPTEFSREGYTFIGWDKDFSNITEDLIVTAVYKINRYEVKFVDWDGSILQADSVDWNTAAIAPANPYRQGYTFTGWNLDFSNVKENMIISALYEVGEDENFAIYFNDADGNHLLANYNSLKVPLAPEIEGFTFLGWQPVNTIIIKDKEGINVIDIEAVYEADEPASAPEVYTIPNNPAQKLIKNGNVYILQGDKKYTLQGQEVK